MVQQGSADQRAELSAPEAVPPSPAAQHSALDPTHLEPQTFARQNGMFTDRQDFVADEKMIEKQNRVAAEPGPESRSVSRLF
eukprot:COSAG02_NODE_1702_length_11245_cov_6.015432_1_plen_81_part_10